MYGKHVVKMQTMALDQDVVELGFVEESQDPEEDFSSQNFPSKVGGKPVWLDPVGLPAPDQLLCNECHKPCIFLLQVYAPHTDDPATYHRSLYVFMCRDPACSKPGSAKSFRVLRCQLPKQNPYYDEDESSSNDSSEDQGSSPNSEAPSQSLPISPPLCDVCGCSGPSKCGQCKAVHYCSQEHQLYHWSNGHKIMCKALTSGGDVSLATNSTVSSFLLPEFQIITETEPPYTGSSKKTEEERLRDFEKYTSSESYKTNCDTNIDLSDELSKLECDNKKEDRLFKSFKKRIARAPEQVLRFQPGGVPLLISNTGSALDSSAMSPCDGCGGSRQFELQVMPQLLHYLKTEHKAQQGHSIDWGTLLIYTCSGNCNPLGSYKEELLWKQDLL